ncbi:FkbM family methyltransferase [Methylobacterium sp. JK268]
MNTIVKRVGWSLARLASQRLGVLSDLGFEAASAYARAYKNLNYDFDSNGELLLLERLRDLPVRTVLDVGANHGAYARACLERFPTAMIHCFEPVPVTFAILEKALAGEPRAIINPRGLSDRETETVIRLNPLDDGRASMIVGIAFDARERWTEVPAAFLRGADYLESHGIDTVDLLKIDVEGAEHLVLQGFGDRLSGERIRVVQFEYGMPNIYSGHLLKDFWRVLEAAGYAVGPLMPDGVDFRAYDPRDEDFQGACNYVAADARDGALLARLRATRRRRFWFSRSRGAAWTPRIH